MSLEIVIFVSFQSHFNTLCYTRLSSDSLDFLSDNLSRKVVKFNLSGLDVEDKHILAIVGKCNKISALCLKWTQITNESLDIISENLELTLEELNIDFCSIIKYTKPFDCKMVELKSMARLRVLNCDKISEDRIGNLRRELPHVTINQERVTNDTESFSPMDGIWEVRVKPMELFQEC